MAITPPDDLIARCNQLRGLWGSQHQQEARAQGEQVLSAVQQCLESSRYPEDHTRLEDMLGLLRSAESLLAAAVGQGGPTALTRYRVCGPMLVEFGFPPVNVDVDVLASTPDDAADRALVVAFERYHYADHPTAWDTEPDVTLWDDDTNLQTTKGAAEHAGH